ncbi:MAG: 23S rRNA (guanosine(2251)-2'-O)-methyltransferase RlmB [Candidatus Enteromonas sp.]|nr:23S rRNA (guanosine(2251)-2'-O)-methyltransferase RlmB [Candidatus Enteromonas sp.]
MEYIHGINAVRETIRSGNAIRIFVNPRKGTAPLVNEAKSTGIHVEVVSDERLFSLSGTRQHQGIIAEVKGFSYDSLEELIAKASMKGKISSLLMLDGIQDPHNFGAILRSCDAFGVSGIIIKSRNQVGVTPTVAKVSTGAINYVPVAMVSNLTNAVKKLKDSGFWIVGTDGIARDTVDKIDVKRPLCIIIGSEGKGISSLLLSECDYVVKIPMVGHVNSLNASVSAGIILAMISFLRGEE